MRLTSPSCRGFCVRKADETVLSVATGPAARAGAAPVTVKRPCVNQHSVQFALAFLFGPLNCQTPQQECDNVFVSVVRYV
jgi:hypothetical protein